MSSISMISLYLRLLLRAPEETSPIPPFASASLQDGILTSNTISGHRTSHDETHFSSRVRERGIFRPDDVRSWKQNVDSLRSARALFEDVDPFV
jgi:hypothetical protein